MLEERAPRGPYLRGESSGGPYVRGESSLGAIS